MRSRWLVLIALLLAIVPTWRASAECAGWQPSPELRRACCAARDHDCGKKGAADDCCAGSEQRQPRVMHDAPAVAHRPATPPVLDETAVGMALVRLSSEQAAVIRAGERDDHALPRTPLHLRLVQLLI